MKSSEIISWSANSEPSHRVDTPLRRTLQLGGLHLRPNWYRLCVWLEGPSVRVSARAGFAQSYADLRMHLEPRGRRRLEKIFKVSEPLAFIDIAAEGAKSDTHIDRIEIRPMRKLSVLTFLAGKGLRYAISNRNRLDWVHAWGHFRAALRPRASFVFQSRYGGNSDQAYTQWRALHENTQSVERVARDLNENLKASKVRVALIFGDEIDETKASTALQLAAGRYSQLEIVPISAARLSQQEAAAQSIWDFALVLDRKGSFAAFAVERMLLALLTDANAQAVFADSDTIAANGSRQEPLLKPPLWDKELLWSSDYVKAPLLLRWNPKISEVLKWQGATHRPSYALTLSLSSQFKQDQLKHLPAILFHESAAPQANAQQTELEIVNRYLCEIGHPGQAEAQLGTRRVAWPLPGDVRVSIIIPSKDNPGLLDTCIQSILQKTIGPKPEIIVADNGSVKPATKVYLRQLELSGTAIVIPCPGTFNFSKINNDARRHAAGDILVFLNDDTQVLSSDWLVELVSLAARPEIGAVGALLLYPDGRVQHAGVLLGIRGIADHAFRHEDGNAPGYLNLLRCRRTVTAVTGACLAVSSAHFDAVGGFEEALAVTANDIDLCLRLHARGWINIWTPWSVLEHAESKSRGIDSTDEALDRQRQETKLFNARWGHLLDRDPTYNPGLSRVASDFSLGIE